jgi:hypothetical protein
MACCFLLLVCRVHYWLCCCHAGLPSGAAYNGWNALSDDWGSPTFKPVSMGLLYFEEKKNWPDAANTCMLLGGSLVSIKDERQNFWVRNVVPSSIGTSELSIGITTDVRRPESSDDPKDWYWKTSDKRGILPGRFMPYNNWQPIFGRQMPDGKDGSCGRMMASGEWANGDCRDLLPFVCELPL